MPEETLNSASCFDDEEKTEPKIEIPSPQPQQTLTLEQFGQWKCIDNKMQDSVPVWLNFYLRFYIKWAKVVYKEEEWLQKLQKTAPGIYAEITGKIEEYHNMCKKFGQDRKDGKLASNIEKPAKILLLLQIEPVLYEAYKVARMFVDSDYELFK